MLAGWDQKQNGSAKVSMRDNALRQHTARAGGPTGARYVYDLKNEGEKVVAREHRVAEERRRHRLAKPTPKNEETPVDPWSWDPSSLKVRDDGGATQTGKVSKRRDGRRQRESEADEDDDEENDRRRLREERKRMKKEKARQRELESAAVPLYLPEFISVSNLADVIGVRPAQFIQQMEDMGFEGVTYSHVLDAETAGLVAAEYNFEPILETGEDDLAAAPEPEDKSILPPRPPVVTIMGHVDHGKTTILDWLRKSSVVASEHGGITQHIGAFSVAMPSGKTITFLDTPGHAAFLDMRRRGADVTDIVVLVVAADDSVKPQTIEAIKHATEAKVPVIVAISKIDKEGGNPEKVKQDLSVHGVHVEDYGGDVQAIGVSGKTGQGMLELEEAIVTLSEILDHRADINGRAEGWVVEGTTKSYGRVATALIRRGTLRPGDIIVAGTTWARVRTLRNEAGATVSEATPGMPVEIDGWREQPSAGTEIIQAADEQQAKEVVDYRLEKSETQKLGQDTVAINEARREVLERRRQEESKDNESSVSSQDVSGPKPVHFVIKSDVGGSAEAVLNSVTAIGNNEVFANVLRSEVGPISEFDIEHAATANGHLISFNMPIDPAMSRMAELRGVKIMDHNIIYKLIDDVKAILSEQLPPSVSHRVTGEAEVGQVFEITVKGREKTAIAGCKVRNGVINRARKVRVIRDQETIFDGMLCIHLTSSSPVLRAEG
jgi:translation initiation factor IF-2